MAYLNEASLSQLGLRSYGRDVKISEWARIYNPSQISIGNNVRIDDFSILSAGDGGINLGSHIHIAAYCSIVGRGAISIADYSGISARVSIYSSSDDYSGDYLTNPVIDKIFTNVDDSPVSIMKHCIIGSGSVVLPGTIMASGVAIGALSLVKGRLDEFTIYAGMPLKRVGKRKNGLINFEIKHQEFYEGKKIF